MKKITPSLWFEKDLPGIIEYYKNIFKDNLKTIYLGDLSNVDSLSWDPHKALMVPLQATFFLCKH